MKNVVFWDVTPCGSCKNRRFGGKYVFKGATRRNIQEDGIHHVMRRSESLKLSDHFENFYENIRRY
jgi:hypothetical protein